MSAAFGAAGAGTITVTSGGALTPPNPAGFVAGDLLIAHVFYGGNVDSPATPSGWTLLRGPDGLSTPSTDGQTWVFGKIAVGGDADPAFGTQATTVPRRARVYSFTGVRSDTVANVVGGFGIAAALGGTVTARTVTSSTDGENYLAVNLIAVADDNAQAAYTGAIGGTWTENVAEFVTTTGTPDTGMGIQTAPIPPSATISGGTFTMASDSYCITGFYIRSATDSTHPVFVAEYETVWNTATTPKTVSVTTAVGDVLVCIGMVGDGTSDLATPTGGTGLTWTLQQSVDTNDATRALVNVWTATATTAQTFTCSMARSGTALIFGFIVLRWSNSSGVGASSKTNVSTGAPSLGLTTTGANSAIVVGNSDWGAIDGTVRNWRQVNGGTAATEHVYFRDAANYTNYVGRHLDAGAAGAQTVGLTAPTGQTYSIVAVEVLGPSLGGSPTTVSPTGVATGEALGTPVLNVPTTSVPTGIATGEALGTPSVALAQTASPGGISTGEAVGTPTVTQGISVAPTGIATGEVLGTPSLTVPIASAPTGISTGAAVGTPALTVPTTSAPGSISSVEALGTPTVTTSVTLTLSGISSGEALGGVTLSTAITASPTAIGSGAATGTPSVVTSGALTPTGIGSAEALGVPTISTSVVLLPGGLGSAAALGVPTVTGNLTTTPPGIATALNIGTPALLTSVTLTLDAISSSLVMGEPVIIGGTLIGSIVNSAGAYVVTYATSGEIGSEVNSAGAYVVTARAGQYTSVVYSSGKHTTEEP